MSKLILSNPLIARYRYSQLRPSTLWIYLTIYVSVVILLLFINSTSNQMSDSPVTAGELYRRLYAQFLAMEVIILWAWATYNSASAVKAEVLNKTYDFFRLLPLSALQKACGILIGKNLLPLLFAAISFVPIVLFGLLGRVSLSLGAQVILLLPSVALFTNSLVLLSPDTASRKQAKTSTTVWILFLIFVAPILLGPLFALVRVASQVRMAEGHYIPFYIVSVPVFLFCGLLALYLGIWNLLGILRRFTFEAEPLFSRKAALLYLIGYELIALGLLLPHMPDPRSTMYTLWLLVSLIPVALIPLGSLRTFDGYLERCGPPRSYPGSPTGGHTGTLLRHSNLTVIAGLCIIWLVFSAIAAMANRMSMAQFAFEGAALLSFCLVLFLLLELYVVYGPIYSKIGVLLGFLAILYLILPLILSAAFAMPALLFYSLFGFFAYLFDPSEGLSTAVGVSILIVNILLCIIPALLIHRRYARVRLLKQEMAGGQHTPAQPGVSA